MSDPLRSEGSRTLDGGSAPGRDLDADVATATAIVRQSDGSLVEAAGSTGSLKLIRFSSTGALDPTFGTGGIATASAAGPDNLNQMLQTGSAAQPAHSKPPTALVTCVQCGATVPANQTTITARGTVCDRCEVGP